MFVSDLMRAFGGQDVQYRPFLCEGGFECEYCQYKQDCTVQSVESQVSLICTVIIKPDTGQSMHLMSFN